MKLAFLVPLFFVGASSEPDPTVIAPEPVACTADAKQCWDGSWVVRDGKDNCEWQPCPPCEEEEKKCRNGKIVKRDLKTCMFPECEAPVACTDDAKKCWDGSYVSRDDSNNCEWFPCPPKPKVTKCEEMKKNVCRKNGAKGCVWMFKEKKCFDQANLKCPAITSGYICKKLKNCSWKSRKCCPKAMGACTKEYKPLKCGDCQYSNPCFAKAAGYNPDECQRVCRNNKQCDKKNGEICYTGFDENCDVDCPGVDKKRCKGVCIKSSKKMCGGMAGLTCPAGEQCVDKKGDKCSPTCGAADCPGVCVDCPKPKPRPCPRILRPVKCGSCTYSNDCLAAAAGFNAKLCKPDKCFGKTCPKIRCRPGYELKKLPGDCCAKCHKIPCSRVPCPLRPCTANSVPYKAPGSCCSTCKPCDKVPCPLIKCSKGYEAYRAPGECCYSKCVKKKLDCSKVLCPVPGCKPGHKPWTAPGECCAKKCVKVDCAKEKCPVLDCLAGWVPYKAPGDCCHSKCVRKKLDCSTVRCRMPACKVGWKPWKAPGDCCYTKCVKPDVRKPDCSTVLCAAPNCKNAVTPVGSCCPVCPKEFPNDELNCLEVICPATNCLEPVTKLGSCCPMCPEALP